jgi:SAM-dependent methyltransferase
MVCLRVTGSSDFSVVREMPLTAVSRPCPLGEGGKVDLVVNGPVVYSYAPGFDHYWFSSVPDEGWFSDYYRTQWGRIARPPEAPGLRATVKKSLGPLLPLVRTAVSLLRGAQRNPEKEKVDSFTLADMQRSFATFAPQLPHRGCVIEVGTGAGDFLKPFIKAGYRARGFEPSPDSAALARAAGVDVVAEFAADDSATRQALSGADLVVSNHSLEHHYDPNRFLSLCALHMRPGAMLGITVPNADTEFLLMTHLFMLHLDSYTPASLDHMLNRHGFRVVDREIGGQLRFLAVKDAAVSQPAPSISFNEAEIRDRYRSRFLSQLPGRETFSIKGARPFRGINYEVCQRGEYGSRTLSVQTESDTGDAIRYATSAPDKAVLVLK